MVPGKGAWCPGFPKHRVVKVLRREKSRGIQSEVKVEGSFIQLSAEGQPTRQVFLGITSQEFVMVKHDLQSSHIPGKVLADPEIWDLVLDLVLPLPVLRFFVLDDRAKRFTVCTCLGDMLYFEMCQLDSSFEESWMNWKRVLINISGDTGSSYGYKSWKTTYILDMKHYNPEFETKLKKLGGKSQGHLKYVQHPFSFNQVCSVGVQTDIRPEAKAVCDAYETGYDESDSDSSSTEIVIPLGERPSRRLDMFSCQQTLVTFSTTDRGKMTTLPTGSCSWTDVSVYDKVSAGEDAPILKLLKKRHISTRGTIQRLIDGDSDTDSEDEMDAFIEGFAVKKKRNGLDLWRKAKQLVIKKTDRLSDGLFAAIAFQFMTVRTITLPTSLADMKPEEVSLAFAAISRRVLMSMRLANVDQYCSSGGRKLPERIAAALDCGRSISKMVAMEILRSQSVLDRTLVIKLFIEVCADLLFYQRDFQSLASILTGLTSLPVYRLENTWYTLFVDEPLAFRKFICVVRILSRKGNFLAYTRRTRMLQNMDAPFIPWLDHFLQHCKKNRRTSEEDFFETRGNVKTQSVRLGKTKFKQSSSSISESKSCHKETTEANQSVLKKNKSAKKKGIAVTKAKMAPQNVGTDTKPKSILAHMSKLRLKCLKKRKNVRFNIAEDSDGHTKDDTIKTRITPRKPFDAQKYATGGDKQDSGQNIDDRNASDTLQCSATIPRTQASLDDTDDESEFTDDEYTSEEEDSYDACLNPITVTKTTLAAVERFSLSLSADIISSALQDIADGSELGDWSDESSEDAEEQDEYTSTDSAFSEEDDYFHTTITTSKKMSEEKAPNVSSQEMSQRRMSYMPSSIQNRRKSMFEEAVHEADDKPDDNLIFEKMKNSALSQMKKKRGSVVLALLEEESDEENNNSTEKPDTTVSSKSALETPVTRHESKEQLYDTRLFESDFEITVTRHESKEQLDDMRIFESDFEITVNRHESKEELDDTRMFESALVTSVKRHESKEQLNDTRMFESALVTSVKRHEIKEQLDNTRIFGSALVTSVKRHEIKEQLDDTRIFESALVTSVKRHESKEQLDDTRMFESALVTSVKRHKIKEQLDDTRMFESALVTSVKRHEIKEQLDDTRIFESALVTSVKRHVIKEQLDDTRIFESAVAYPFKRHEIKEKPDNLRIFESALVTSIKRHEIKEQLDDTRIFESAMAYPFKRHEIKEKPDNRRKFESALVTPVKRHVIKEQLDNTNLLKSALTTPIKRHECKEKPDNRRKFESALVTPITRSKHGKTSRLKVLAVLARRNVSNSSNASKEKKKRTLGDKSETGTDASKSVAGPPCKKRLNKPGHGISKSLSLENHCSSLDECPLCAMHKCVYVSDMRQQLLKIKAGAMKMRPRARQSVETYIQNGIKMGSLLTEYDILKLSLLLN